MIAADIMTNPVITIEENESVQTCAARLLEHRISALPVVDSQEHLVGIISEGDLMRRSELGAMPREGAWWLEWLKNCTSEAKEFIQNNTQRVGDLMTREVVTASPDTSLAEIASLLDKRRIKRVPIVENKRMVGLISRANLLHALAAQSTGNDTILPQQSTDRELRTQLLQELRKHGWFKNVQSNVLVNDGVVEFFGLVDNDNERRAAQVLAENTPGVKAVHDHRVILDRLPVVGA